MVTTRSMSRSNPTSNSGPTKTVKPPKVVERNSTRRKFGTAKTVKPPKWIERNPTRREALSIFMIKEYLPQYYEVNPPCPTRPDAFEVVRFGHEKWFYMSESEKARWIELAEKMLAKGISLQNIGAPAWFKLLEASN